MSEDREVDSKVRRLWQQVNGVTEYLKQFVWKKEAEDEGIVVSGSAEQGDRNIRGREGDKEA
jgi:hypothetical protein